MLFLFSVKHWLALSTTSGGWCSKKRKPVSGSVFARRHLIKSSFRGNFVWLAGGCGFKEDYLNDGIDICI